MQNDRKVPVAVAGARGYSGQVLCGLLSQHPVFELKAKLSREDCETPKSFGAQTVFLCTPADVSATLAPAYLGRDLHVVDLSGAYRLQAELYPQFYHFEHPHPVWLARAKYGLHPYCSDEISQASHSPTLISNPGCYATATELLLIPLYKSGIIGPDRGTFIDAKSGSSGAGKKASEKLLFTELFGNFAPYRVGAHAHQPEILHTLKRYTGHDTHCTFITSLLPVDRGIQVSVFFDAPYSDGLSTDEAFKKLLACFHSLYANSPEISICAEQEGPIEMKSIVGRCGANLYLRKAFDKIVLFSCIDNLMHGAASQALMNANLLYSLDPLCGLEDTLPKKGS